MSEQTSTEQTSTGEGGARPSTTFSTDPSGLTEAGLPAVVRLADGDRFDLRAGPVAKRLGVDRVRMLAYNGSIPGPTLRVRQGSEITVRVRNDTDVETTVHWHGLRLDNPSDGVPHETQPPIEVGGEYTCTVRFPDPGLYWYHPHVREDYGLDMGLYGSVVVDPVDDGYWPAVDREVVVTLDDVLIEGGQMAPYRLDGPTHVAMGRFGNRMVTAGQEHLHVEADAGEVVRFFFTNTANTRLFNVAVPGARMKLVGGDNGRYEHETWTEEVLLAPSERAIVDVLFDDPGSYALAHRAPDRSYTLGSIKVRRHRVAESRSAHFGVLRSDDHLGRERGRLEADRYRTPDKTLACVSLMPLLHRDAPTAADAWTCPMHPEVVRSEPGTCPRCGMRLIPGDAAEPAVNDHGDGHDHGASDGLEWEDLMPEINGASDAETMSWKLVDRATGAENAEIDWTFTVGDRIKIRLENGMDQDHPMHHPFHIHGAGRFLVLARDGEPDDNLVWKDTILVRAGQTVDILLEVTNPGLWMAHCHIAEHAQAGMMFSFTVTEAADA